MKVLLTILLWLAAAPACAETLALVVHYDQGDVGEEHRVMTTSYFTNDAGLLVRRVLVSRGEYGDPDTTYERIYHWDKDGVSWSTNEEDAVPLPRSLRFQDGSLLRTIGDALVEAPSWAGPPKTLRYLDAEQTTWSDGDFVFCWAAGRGYSEQQFGASSAGSDPRFGWTTSGGSLVEWFKGNENNRVILDRRPTAIHGTFVQPNEQLTGWNVTGELDVSGPGLWHPDPLVRLAHMSILDDDGNLAYVAPLIWKFGYLR